MPVLCRNYPGSVKKFGASSRIFVLLRAAFRLFFRMCAGACVFWTFQVILRFMKRRWKVWKSGRGAEVSFASAGTIPGGLLFVSVLLFWIAPGVSGCVDSGDLTNLLDSALDRSSSESPATAPEPGGTPDAPSSPGASRKLGEAPAEPDREYIYQWTDRDGNIHFTTEFSRVPVAYRENMKRIPKSPSAGSPAAVPPVFPNQPPSDIPMNEELERIRRERNVEEIRRARRLNRENMDRAREKIRKDEIREREERKREKKERERRDSETWRWRRIKWRLQTKGKKRRSYP